MNFNLKDIGCYDEKIILTIFKDAQLLLKSEPCGDIKLLIKSIQVFRNSIGLKKFPNESFTEFLDFIFYCLSFKFECDDKTIKLVSFQALHNFLCSENDLHQNEYILLKLLNTLIFICVEISTPTQIRTIIWLIFHVYSSKIFSCDYVCSCLNFSLISNIFNAVDESEIENGNILLTNMLEKSSRFVENIFTLCNPGVIAQLLYFIDEANICLSTENTKFLIDYLLMKVKEDKDLFKQSDQSQLDIVKLTFMILSNINNIKEIIPCEMQIAFVKSMLDVLRILRQYDEDPQENKIFKSHYSFSKNETFIDRPIFNIKKFIIKLISSLVHDNKSIQSFVVDSGGLELIMSSTRIDLCNPYIQQHAILAIKNICTSNKPACDRILSLTKTDEVDKELLDILNYTEIERDGIKMFVPNK